MKVYVVTFGAYSDSYVGCVYTNQDDADATARAGGGYVEEHELDLPLSEAETRHLRPGEHVYQVGMYVDGSGAHADKTWQPRPHDGLFADVGYDNKVGYLKGTCWALSEEHAIKILNDRRSQWIAMGSLIGTRKSDGWYVALLIPATVIG